MAEILIGTAGWDYKDWVGTFYPKSLERKEHLTYYADYFNVVEVNSTFYSLPDAMFVERWREHTPSDFKFIIKVWQEITHNYNDSMLEGRISEFFYNTQPLSEKISAFLFQFPPWFKYSDEHLRKLTRILEEAPSEYRYVVELRDDSWFTPNILSQFINGSQIILGTTYIPACRPYYFEHQDTYYIRLIGDRELTQFNRIQRPQLEALKDLNQKIDELKQKGKEYQIFIIVNNHFAGFAPESANQLKERFNLPLKKFNKQRHLTDFI